MKQASKVLVDVDGGNNMLYLPLDHMTKSAGSSSSRSGSSESRHAAGCSAAAEDGSSESSSQSSSSNNRSDSGRSASGADAANSSLMNQIGRASCRERVWVAVGGESAEGGAAVCQVWS